MKDFTVFMSYSHHDGQDYAVRLSELLKHVFSDINVFWDRGLIAGQDVWGGLLEKVRHCDVFLYLVSDRSTSMPSGCIREYSWAMLYEKHVVPCILPTFTGDPNGIPGFPELKDLLYVDLRKGIEDATDENAKLYGAIYESILNASPITQFHRKEMILLFEILGKLTDDIDNSEGYKVGVEVYERGFEFEYHEYPNIEGRVSEAVCLEVIDCLEMMESLQGAWKEFNGAEKIRIQKAAGNTVDYLVNNVGFCGNHEAEHLSYMRFLKRDDKFTQLSYAFGNGNSHMPNLPRYRAMLEEYQRIKQDGNNDFYRDRFHLSVEEVFQILQAQNGVLSHPL